MEQMEMRKVEPHFPVYIEKTKNKQAKQVPIMKIENVIGV